jgi:hypothetical protein
VGGHRTRGPPAGLALEACQIPAVAPTVGISNERALVAQLKP